MSSNSNSKNNHPPITNRHLKGSDSFSFDRDLRNALSGEEFADLFSPEPDYLDRPAPNSHQFKFIPEEPPLAVDEISASFAQEELDEGPISLREILDEILGQAGGEPTSSEPDKQSNYYSEAEMTNDPSVQQQQQQQPQFNHTATNNKVYVKPESHPYVTITEQPAKCSIRFRYECEGRSAGSIPGINSTADNRTYPTIKICNYVGRAVVVVSCVTKEQPYRAHPHNIVGRENARREGICTVVIDHCEGETIRSFPSIGIQCVKKRDTAKSLEVREKVRVDPFNNGFGHKENPNSIDLSVVRLCFQVFIEGSTPMKCDVALQPVVSDPIHDKKAMSDLVIVKLSHCSAPATGGREVILLCDRINKDDIAIRFFEERDDELIWETFTELASTNFHKQVAICFRTPKYRDENIVQPVMCKIELVRMSDNQTSEPRSFQFLPCESDEDIISRKRHKVELAHMNYQALDLLHHQQHQSQQQHQLQEQQHPRLHLHPLRPSTSQQYRQQPQHNQQQQQQQQQMHHHIHNHHHHQQLAWTPDPSPSPMPMSTPSPYSQHTPVPGSSRQTSISPTNNINISNNNRQGELSTPPNVNRASPQDNRYPAQPAVCESNSVRVRARWVDNSGNVMQLVDGPSDRVEVNHRQQEANNFLNNFNKTLASSLERINTAELVGNLEFNTDIDLNLGSGLSAHLNAATSNQDNSLQQFAPGTNQNHQNQLHIQNQNNQIGNSNFTLNNPTEPHQIHERYTPDEGDKNC